MIKKEKIILIFLLIISLVSAFILIISIFNDMNNYKNKNIIEINRDIPIVKLSEMDYIFLSFCKVESNFKKNAINKSSGASGIIQIMPDGKRGYLDEANRITGYKKYNNKDLFCEIKSREIFDIVQKKYNPDCCIYRAIKSMNPRCSNLYSEKVLNAYFSFKNDTSIKDYNSFLNDKINNVTN